MAIIGVDEGGSLNFTDALKRSTTPEEEFIRETGTAWKPGFVHKGWRSIFHIINWMFAGVPFGVIPLTAAQAKLMRILPDARAKVPSYFRELTNDRQPPSDRNAVTR